MQASGCFLRRGRAQQEEKEEQQNGGGLGGEEREPLRLLIIEASISMHADVFSASVCIVDVFLRLGWLYCRVDETT